MWLTWLKTAAAGLLAFAAVAGLVAVGRDQPYVYPVLIRAGPMTGFVHASLRHVAVGGWRTVDDDPLQSLTAHRYWTAASLHVFTDAIDRGTERADTDSQFKRATLSARLSEVGVLYGLPGDGNPSYTEAIVPTWLAVVAGVAPLAVVVTNRVRHRRRFLVGHCRRCGYDLRATTDRCPECGAAIGPAAAAAAA